jgi:hypothetical protein
MIRRAYLAFVLPFPSVLSVAAPTVAQTRPLRFPNLHADEQGCVPEFGTYQPEGRGPRLERADPPVKPK